MKNQKDREQNSNHNIPSRALENNRLGSQREPLAQTINEISQVKDIPKDPSIKTASKNQKNPCIWQGFKIFDEDVKNDHDKYPETVSKFWIPLNKMKEIAPYNQTFKRCIETIKIKFSAWKKSRGDGNCYYRAVMYSFLEKLLKPHSATTELENFLAKLRSGQDEEYLRNFSQFETFLACKNVLIQYLDWFLSLKQKSPVQAFLEFLKYSQDPNLDQSMFMTGRLLSAGVIARSDERIRDFIFEDVGMTVENILRAGEEAADLELFALPIALGIQVVHYSIFESVVAHCYPEENNSSLDPISIIRRSGHYDILYTKREHEMEQYSLDEGKYNFLMSNDN